MRSCLLPLAFAALVAVPRLCPAADDVPPADAAAKRPAVENAAATEPSPERIATLVRDLGSEEYAARERASETLAEIGLPAYAAIRAAAADPDREVRYRALRILGLVRQQDLERRLEAFLRGQDADDDYPLPGWPRFKKTYGADTSARRLFVAMQRADAELLNALDESPRAAADALTQRTLQYQQALQLRQEQLSLGQVAATLFVAAEQDVALPPSTMMMIFSYCDQPGFREVLSGSSRDLPRQMLGALITRSEDLSAYQAMTLAFRFDMAEGLVPAIKILEGRGNNRQPHMIQVALMTVSRLGDASHLPLVEKLMTDTTLLTRLEDEKKDVYDVQVRDAALAAAIVLTQQKLGAYFEVPPQIIDFDPQMVFFNARMIGFPSDEKRAAVFAKWEEYKAGQSRGTKPAKTPPPADKS